jgi:hypothetical protein
MFRCSVTITACGAAPVLTLLTKTRKLSVIAWILRVASKRRDRSDTSRIGLTIHGCLSASRYFRVFFASSSDPLKGRFLMLCDVKISQFSLTNGFSDGHKDRVQPKWFLLEEFFCMYFFVDNERW